MNQKELTDRLGKKERIKKINKLFSKLDVGVSVDEYEQLNEGFKACKAEKEKLEDVINFHNALCEQKGAIDWAINIDKLNEEYIMVSGPATEHEQLESANHLISNLKEELKHSELKFEAEYKRRIFIEQILKKIID